MWPQFTRWACLHHQLSTKPRYFLTEPGLQGSRLWTGCVLLAHLHGKTLWDQVASHLPPGGAGGHLPLAGPHLHPSQGNVLTFSSGTPFSLGPAGSLPRPTWADSSYPPAPGAHGLFPRLSGLSFVIPLLPALHAPGPGFPLGSSLRCELSGSPVPGTH